MTRNHLALLRATQLAVTHLLKSERKRRGAGGSETLDTSTVQRPSCVVCKRSTVPVTNSSGFVSCSGEAGKLERRQRSVVLGQASPVIFFSGEKKKKRERGESVKIRSALGVNFYTCVVPVCSAKDLMCKLLIASHKAKQGANKVPDCCLTG